MSKNNSSTAGAVIGLPTLLTVAFVILKLCHVIEWSWWWVISPILIEIGFALLLIILLIFMQYHSLKHMRDLNERWSKL